MFGLTRVVRAGARPAAAASRQATLRGARGRVVSAGAGSGTTVWRGFAVATHDLLSRTPLRLGRGTPMATAVGTARAVWTSAAPEGGSPAGLSNLSPERAALIGTWEGKIDAGGDNLLRMIWRVTEDECFFDFPDASQFDNPSIPSLDGTALKFEMKGVGAFTGTVTDDGCGAVGKWEQGGVEFPLELVRTVAVPKTGHDAAEARFVRPQRPSLDPPYDVVEVVIPNQVAGVALSGTLTLPPGAAGSVAGVPAVVLLCGSGPHTRNQSIFGHECLWVMADHLTKNGIAVLRYDKRGVGTSTGTFKGSSPVDFALDAAAAVHWLRNGAGGAFKPSTVGMLGHSEGALVATMVATARGPEEVSFVGLLAGMGLPGHELVLRQGYDVQAAEGVPTELLDAMQPFNKRIFEAAASSMSNEKLSEEIVAAREAARLAIPSEAHDVLGLVFEGRGIKAADDAAVASITVPDVLWLLRYDPKHKLKDLRCPTLVLAGGKDLQVPAENFELVCDVLKEHNPTGLTTKEFPNCNHLFQTCETGAVSEYEKIEETCSPEVLNTMTSWVRKVTKLDQ